MQQASQRLTVRMQCLAQHIHVTAQHRDPADVYLWMMGSVIALTAQQAWSVTKDNALFSNSCVGGFLPHAMHGHYDGRQNVQTQPCIPTSCWRRVQARRTYQERVLPMPGGYIYIFATHVTSQMLLTQWDKSPPRRGHAMSSQAGFMHVSHCTRFAEED